MITYIINPVAERKTKSKHSKNGGQTMARRRKKRRARKRRYRRNPVTTLVGSRRRKRRYRRNPGPALGRASFRRMRAPRRYRRNPTRLRGGIKRAFSRENIMTIGMTAVGFIGGIKGAKYLNTIEALQPMRKFTGAITF